MAGNQADRARFLREISGLGIDVSRETETRLEALVQTLARWQKAINLVSRSTLEEVWTRHILDSAQLVPLIPPAAKGLVDLGSGGGFPGLVVAALRPDLEITLADSDSRKVAYLAEAARQMELPRAPKTRLGRIEALPPAGADVVTARALAPLSQLLVWADRHRGERAICLFHKGKGWREELTTAHKDWEIEAEPFPSVTDRDAILLRIAAYRAKDLRDR